MGGTARWSTTVDYVDTCETGIVRVLVAVSGGFFWLREHGRQDGILGSVVLELLGEGVDLAEHEVFVVVPMVAYDGKGTRLLSVSELKQDPRKIADTYVKQAKIDGESFWLFRA
jgi:hypothetical protein